MRTIRVVTLATLLMASDVAMPRSQAQQPGVNRIDLQRHDLSTPGGIERERRHLYAAPARLALNQWALAGDWTMGVKAAALNSPPAEWYAAFTRVTSIS